MAETVALRPLRWPDLAVAERLEQEAFGTDAWSAEALWGELAGVGDQRIYLAAERDGQLVGYGGLILAGPECEIATIVVADEASGHGVGRRLLVALLAAGEQTGARRVHLEVRADNAAAIALYLGLGFEHVSRRSRYYGDGVDALTMRARLPVGETDAEAVTS